MNKISTTGRLWCRKNKGYQTLALGLRRVWNSSFKRKNKNQPITSSYQPSFHLFFHWKALATVQMWELWPWKGFQDQCYPPAATSLKYKLLEFKLMPRTCLGRSSSPSWWLFTLFMFFNKVLCVWEWGSPCIPKFGNSLLASTQWVFSLEPFPLPSGSLGQSSVHSCWEISASFLAVLSWSAPLHHNSIWKTI